MVPDSQYLTDYLREAAIQQTRDRYARAGYTVARDVVEDGCQADMVAIRGDQRVYFQVKVQGRESRRNRDILQLKRHLEGQGGELKLIYVTPPRPVNVEVEGIEGALRAYLLNEPPPVIDTLSWNSRVDDVSDVEFDEILVSADAVKAHGTLTLTVALQHGSDADVRRDMGMDGSASFPARFRLEADRDLKIISLETEVDISGWEE